MTPPRGRALWAPGFQPGTQRAQPLKGESGCGRASPSRDCLSPSGLRLLRSVCGMTAFRFGAWCGTPRSLGVPHPTPPPQPCHTLRSADLTLRRRAGSSSLPTSPPSWAGCSSMLLHPHAAELSGHPAFSQAPREHSRLKGRAVAAGVPPAAIICRPPVCDCSAPCVA